MTTKLRYTGHPVTWLWRYGIPVATSIFLLMDMIQTLRRTSMQGMEKPSHDVHRIHHPLPPPITFKDIGGLQEVKERLRLEVSYPQSQSALYHAYHRTPGTGILLYGPPGCGKTLLAKAVAHECGNEMTFHAPPIAEILSRWVGQSEKRVTQLFAALAQTRPAILFLDELDALLPRSGPSYMRRIKNTFLQCMDGITSTMDQLLIMGATNRPWLIDPAVRRPGRFSHQILIPPPDLQARQAIFNLNLAPLRNNALVAADVDVLELALLTSGYSGADITAICHDARDIPLHEALQGHGQRPLTQQDFATALTRRQPSILPWMIEATRAIKRYQEHRCFPDILKLATDLQDATKP